MKNTIYLFTLLIGLFSNAQQSTLFDYTWQLEFIELNGTTLFQPVNEESTELITINFYEDDLFEPTIYFEHNLICDVFGCEVVVFSGDDTFDFFGCGITLDGCSIEENTTFQSNYTIVFYSFNTAEVFSPFTYSFTTEDNVIYLTILNSLGNSATYSATLLNNTRFESSQFTIYPNPVHAQLNIESESFDIQNLEIFNLTGKQLLQKKYNPNETLDVSSLVNGLYVLKINTEDGTFTKKLVKK
jgi:hypothetical protein